MLKVFCFSIAGGGSDIFNCFDNYVTEKFELIKLEYPGHGKRISEPLLNDLSKVVEDLYNQVIKNIGTNDDYVLFGYSMGSMFLSLTLEMIISIREIKEPKHVFLCAHSPNVSNKKISLEEIEDDEHIKNLILSFGGIPSDLVNNKLFWNIYLPIYKSDYKMMCSFDYDKLKLNTAINTTIFYSESDTPLKEMKKWKKFYNGEVNFIQMEGNHFFIKENAQELIEQITKIIKN